MTEQEKRIQKHTTDAIELLGFLKKDFENKAKPRCKFARVRAGLFFGIKALEKQIAKKPLGTTMAKDKDTSVGSIGRCPCCDGIVAEDMLWCDDCGQKLDWE